eukprot:CAMPEP_0171476182 /NCGR_PEP_ID=MMETSP0946-20130122/3438_1 /TAXON_ID=109269 /ORGANISM="Vaucheria litorea, Strain CCMP2940" /LENGTH=321 /DNA_ID=CAMNT_0012006395 /DNA_START=26 /DNA_END=988 /DNA_ORIENTATION=+
MIANLAKAFVTFFTVSFSFKVTNFSKQRCSSHILKDVNLNSIEEYKNEIKELIERTQNERIEQIKKYQIELNAINHPTNDISLQNENFNYERKLTKIHPAYSDRLNRVGLDDRWGHSEIQRIEMNQHTPKENTQPQTSKHTQPNTLQNHFQAKTNHHKGYAERLERIGWFDRWGNEETNRIKQSDNFSTLKENDGSSAAGNEMEQLRAFIADYIEKSGKERSDLVSKLERTELAYQNLKVEFEQLRTAYAKYMLSSQEQKISSLEKSKKDFSSNKGFSEQTNEQKVTGIKPHPAYLKRAKSKGINDRWGNEEISRIATVAL